MVSVWDCERGTIQQFANAMADEVGALPVAEQYQKLLAAIWREEITATDRDAKSLTRDKLRDMVRLFDNRWRGCTLLEITKRHTGWTLQRMLLELFPTLKPEKITRLVNGYPPPREPSLIKFVQKEPDDPDPLPDILVNGGPATPRTRLREGQLVSLPHIEPFIADLTFDDLATWGQQDYSDKLRKACLDHLHIATKDVRAWRRRLTSPSEPISSEHDAPEKACRQWLCNWMRETNSRPLPKAKIREIAMDKFEISHRGFDRAWAWAMEDVGNANWSRHGPTQKS